MRTAGKFFGGRRADLKPIDFAPQVVRLEEPVIGRELGVTASTLAADVFPAFDDPSVSECAPKNVFGRRANSSVGR